MKKSEEISWNEIGEYRLVLDSFVTVTDLSQCCRVEVSTAEEAVACESPSKS